MTSFATPDDLSEFLGRDVDDGRASIVLEMASGAIVAELDQEIVLHEEDSITLDGSGRDVVLLPELPVIAVTEVVLDGTTLDPGDYVLESGGILRRVKGGVGLWRFSDSDWQAGWGRASTSWGPNWGTKPKSIAVTYDHGYAVIPDAIRGLCIALASQLVANPSGYTQESIGNYSYSYGRIDVGALAFSDTEKRMLDPFRAITAA